MNFYKKRRIVFIWRESQMDDQFEAILLAEKQIKKDIEEAQISIREEMRQLEVSKERVLKEVLSGYQQELNLLTKDHQNKINDIQNHMSTVIEDQKLAYQTQFNAVTKELKEDIIKQVVSIHES